MGILLGDTSFWKNQSCLFSIVNVLMSVILTKCSKTKNNNNTKSHEI